eukprot:scaffold131781_cov18-Tisochrysis_lutea.AAC.1
MMVIGNFPSSTLVPFSPLEHPVAVILVGAMGCFGTHFSYTEEQPSEPQRALLGHSVSLTATQDF